MKTASGAARLIRMKDATYPRALLAQILSAIVLPAWIYFCETWLSDWLRYMDFVERLPYYGALIFCFVVSYGTKCCLYLRWDEVATRCATAQWTASS